MNQTEWKGVADSLTTLISEANYSNPQSARVLIEEYNLLAQKYGHQGDQLNADYLLAKHYLIQAHFDSLDAVLLTALHEAMIQKDTLAIVELRKIEGLKYYYLGEFTKGIQTFLEDIHLAEQAGDDYLAAYYNNIGICYEKLGKYNDALDYYHLALDIDMQKPNNDYAIRAMANNIAVIYLNRSQFQAAYDLLQPICDTLNGPGINNLHLDLAHAFSRALFGMGEITKSIQVGEEALQLAITVDDPIRIILHYLGLGDRYKELSQPVKAIENYERALSQINKHHIEEQKATVYRALKDTYTQMSNYENALYYADLLYDQRDSLNIQQDMALIRELDEKYQSSIKDKMLLENQLELANRKRRNHQLIFLMIGLLFLGYYGYQTQLKSRKLSEQELRIASQHIDELKKEQRIRSLSSMIEGQEAERHRIARDLHDGLGGLLTLVKTQMGQMQKQISKLENKNLYQSTSEMIDKACDEVRRISQNMMPGVLRVEGLEGAVEDLVMKVGEMQRLKTSITLNFNPEELTDAHSHMMYRIIQECINNILKHSQATEFVVQIIDYSDHLHMLIEDNGIGFNPETQRTGLGLKSIRSRVDYLNGDLDIATSDQGTSISINIPLTHGND